MIGVRKFRLISADARGGGTRDQSRRESVWQATHGLFSCGQIRHLQQVPKASLQNFISRSATLISELVRQVLVSSFQ